MGRTVNDSREPVNIFDITYLDAVSDIYYIDDIRLKHKGSPHWTPQKSSGYRRWSLPAQTWSGADYSDETIKIIWDHGHWMACTEVNQCVHRDLDDAEIASVREEFALNRYLPEA